MDSCGGPVWALAANSAGTILAVRVVFDFLYDLLSVLSQSDVSRLAAKMGA